MQSTVGVQVPGDLDPRVSPHYLTTMKKAYLKLRYLVDSGCIFVGHDLRHDFKSINIIVPPQQVSHCVAGRRHLGIQCMSHPIAGTSVVVMSAHRFVKQKGFDSRWAECSDSVTIDLPAIFAKAVRYQRQCPQCVHVSNVLTKLAKEGLLVGAGH